MKAKISSAGNGVIFLYLKKPPWMSRMFKGRDLWWNFAHHFRGILNIATLLLHSQRAGVMHILTVWSISLSCLVKWIEIFLKWQLMLLYSGVFWGQNIKI